MKFCQSCQQWKPLTAFNKRKGRKIGSRCKECNRAACREYDRNRKINDPTFLERERLRAFAKRHNNQPRRINQMFNSVRKAAAKRGITFNIVQAQIHVMLEIQNWKCAKTGICFDLTAGQGIQPFGPTIDRINNNLGYEPTNIQIVCNMYNFAKNCFTDDDVMKMAKALLDKSLC